MNARPLSSVEESITRQQVPNDGDLFAGADLFVTDDLDVGHHVAGVLKVTSKDSPFCRTLRDWDLLVASPLARKISWVIFQMKSVFSDEIDHLNKLTFYPTLGEAAIAATQAGMSDAEILMAIVSEAKDFWSNRPLPSQ